MSLSLVLGLIVLVMAWAPAGSPSATRLRRLDPGQPADVPLATRVRSRIEAARRSRTAPEPLNREEVADLVGRLAALTRAGVAPGRAWQVLAMGSGPAASIARVTADMAASGGSTADGLRLAVDTWPHSKRPPTGLAAVGWLALATDVIERSGAPSAVVHEGMAAGILAELARIDDQEVALAGARATAKLLAALPLVGAGLGYLMGANVLGVLTGSTAGRLCLILGAGSWIAGRLWTRRLVTRAATAL